MTAMSARLYNLLEGAGSLMSVNPTMSSKHRRLYDPAPSVEEALEQDWRKLAKDFRKSAKKVMNGEK